MWIEACFQLCASAPLAPSAQGSVADCLRLRAGGFGWPELVLARPGSRSAYLQAAQKSVATAPLALRGVVISTIAPLVPWLIVAERAKSDKFWLLRQ